VEDLKSGHDVALVIETRAAFAEAWARTLAALQNGRVPTLALGRNIFAAMPRLPSD
jgi:hypothetical protein